MNGEVRRLEVVGAPGEPKAHWVHIVEADTHRIEVDLEVHHRQLTFTSLGDPWGWDGVVRWSGNMWIDSRIWEGMGEAPDESSFS